MIVSRKAQARERIRARLVSRGLALSAALVASLFHEGTASAAIPYVLLDSTIRAATAVTVGGAVAAGSVAASVQADTLAEGMVRAMFITKVKIAIATLLLAVVGLGAVW